MRSRLLAASNPVRQVEVAHILEALASEARMRWSSSSGLHFETSFSSATYGLFVEVEPQDFKRALSNIANNAAEACGEQGKVQFHADVGEERVLIAISDTGCGMPESVVRRLGEFGNSQGKADGNGLGIPHAIKFAQASGGCLTFTSKPAEGTVATFNFPRCPTPAWFTSSLDLHPRQRVVVLDDDESIHQVWRQRLKAVLLRTKGEARHYRDHLAFEADSTIHAGALCLVDYELLNTQETGLALITRLGIRHQSILVTSHAEDPDIQRRCVDQNVALLSKNGAGLVPINIAAERSVDFVVLDDDPLVHAAWRLFARRNSKRVLSFSSAEDLLGTAESLELTVPIHVDYHLGSGIHGHDVCRSLKDLGFQKLYLATGESPDRLPPCPWITAVVGKGPHSDVR